LKLLILKEKRRNLTQRKKLTNMILTITQTNSLKHELMIVDSLFFIALLLDVIAYNLISIEQTLGSKCF